MYQSLYRKYRPNNFENVYGQDVAKKILINSLKKNKISHAYLFFGPRGTGKTSIAKLFARACNCLDSKSGFCCEKCDNCYESIQKNCVDIIEIDAASNNGVDEIRELKNKINLVPNKLKYKVYIIDEVHMLSIGAFNALLKTLEEPPEHVIFILATTDYYKVPSTIISRCQTIEFKKINDKNMFDRLKNICEYESIKINNDAINEIINNSDGGLRDALSTLDKVNIYSKNDESISINEVDDVLGIVSKDEINNYISNLKVKNMNDIQILTDEYLSVGKNVYKMLSDILEILINQTVINQDYSNVDLIKVIYKYYNELKKSNNKKLVLNMMIYELYSTNVRENISREINLDSITNQSNAEISIDNYKTNDEFIKIRINNAFVDANRQILSDAKKNWQKLKDHTFDQAIGSYICDLLDCVPIVASNTNIIISSEYDSVADKINNNIEIYEDILNKNINFNKKIICISDKRWNEEKTEYLKKIKIGYKYELIDENIIDDSEHMKSNIFDSIENKAHKLFGEILK